jgi:hypothetical protein
MYFEVNKLVYNVFVKKQYDRKFLVTVRKHAQPNITVKGHTCYFAQMKCRNILMKGHY